MTLLQLQQIEQTLFRLLAILVINLLFIAWRVSLVMIGFISLLLIMVYTVQFLWHIGVL